MKCKFNGCELGDNGEHAGVGCQCACHVTIKRYARYRGTIAYRSGVGGMVNEGFCASLVAAWDFLLRTPGTIYEVVKHDLSAVHFMRGLSCMLYDSANQIADGFLGDWVLMLDTDHVFKSDALYEMVETFEGGGPGHEGPLDILTGFAQKRQPPYTPLIYRTDFDPMQPFEPIIPQGLDRQMILPVDSSGCACLMVRRKVFDAIKKAGERPFDMRPKFNTFDLSTHESMNVALREDLPPDRHITETFWEDVSFFWRAKMLGYKAFCAPWIKFHHIEQRLVTDDMIQPEHDPRIPR